MEEGIPRGFCGHDLCTISPFGSRNLNLGAKGTDVAIVQAVYNLMLATTNPPLGPVGTIPEQSGRPHRGCAKESTRIVRRSLFRIGPGNAHELGRDGTTHGLIESGTRFRGVPAWQ